MWRLAAWSSRSARDAGGLLGALALGACAWQGPGLGGYDDGLQLKVTSFYADNAIEKNMSCTQPQMTPVGTQVVSETTDRIVMKVRYYWWDDTQHAGQDTVMGGRRHAGGMSGYCNGWGERTFTIARNGKGGMDVIGMTGATRG